MLGLACFSSYTTYYVAIWYVKLLHIWGFYAFLSTQVEKKLDKPRLAGGSRDEMSSIMPVRSSAWSSIRCAAYAEHTTDHTTTMPSSCGLELASQQVTSVQEADLSLLFVAVCDWIRAIQNHDGACSHLLRGCGLYIEEGVQVSL
jgi:hypothetical protein